MSRAARGAAWLVALALCGGAAAQREGRDHRWHRGAVAASVFNATDRAIEFMVRYPPEPRWETNWVQPGQTLSLKGPGSAQACEVAFADRGGVTRTARLAFDRVSGWRRRYAEGPLHSFVRHRRELKVVPGRARTEAENISSFAEGLAGLVTAVQDLEHGNRIQAANRSGATILLRLRYRPGGSRDWQTVGTWTFQPGETSFLAHENRQLRTKTPVLFFEAEEVGGPRRWDGPVVDGFEGRPLRFREYRRAPDADGIIRLPIDP